jgi:hypothetical protein
MLLGQKFNRKTNVRVFCDESMVPVLLLRNVNINYSFDQHENNLQHVDRLKLRFEQALHIKPGENSFQVIDMQFRIGTKYLTVTSENIDKITRAFLENDKKLLVKVCFSSFSFFDTTLDYN